MKIICIARNYSDHAAEMGAPRYQRGSMEAVSPAFFLKPETALLQNGLPFHYPAFSNEVEHEVELVVRIDREGGHIAESDARQFYNYVTLGIDFTARDLQRQAKAKGLPWTLSKGFDESAVLGEFVSLSDFGGDVNNLSFCLCKNGSVVQQGCTADMLCDVDKMIAFLSRFMHLCPGDLIYSGTPSGVGPVSVGDELTASLEGRQLMRCKVV